MCKIDNGNGTKTKANIHLGLKEWGIFVTIIATCVGAAIVIGSDRRGLNDHLSRPHLNSEDFRAILKQEIAPVLERIEDDAERNDTLHQLQDARLMDLHDRMGRAEGKLWPDGPRR